MEVQCLEETDALYLFQKKVGQRTLGCNPEIPDLAKLVARKCCGLPLALNVIGETMSCKRTIEEWRNALNLLNSYAPEFSGKDEKILWLLKFSYDNLEGEHVKSSLLYCALFPEDAKISKEELIDYWICEGIIDKSESIKDAKDMGYGIIGSLVRASLLLEENTELVYLHDVIREMALWIASDIGNQKEDFIVGAGVGLYEMPKISNWKVVRRISLMHYKIGILAGSPECLELTTLLLQSRYLSKISSEFFKSMPKLSVLDLSYNNFLSKLPEGISSLISLQYLNLSRTAICHLPKNLQTLKKLIHLDLEETLALRSIGGISSLQSLKVLKLYDSRFTWDLNTVKELEALEHLEVLTTPVIDCRSPGAEQYLTSHRLMSCTQSLKIKQLESSGILLLETMDKLRKFSIIESKISEIKMGRICSSLVEVDIRRCKGLRELTFLMSAPNLTSLLVDSLPELEDIINEEKACQVEILQEFFLFKS